MGAFISAALSTCCKYLYRAICGAYLKCTNCNVVAHRYMLYDDNDDDDGADDGAIWYIQNMNKKIVFKVDFFEFNYL